jgi:hypothetical protein
MRVRLAVACLLAATAVASARAANWDVKFINNVPLPNPSSGVVLETSCVTYMGPVGNAYRFISGEQNHDNIVRFDVTFNANGGIAGIANVVNIPINAHYDFEGIAYTNAARNSVFLSEENGPAVREINLANGQLLQSITMPSIPSVFANRRDNRGFESLTRTRDGTTMWTGNEEALSVDGPSSTDALGSVVRLLKLNVSGNAVTAGPQYAYRVSPIHSTNGPSRSGLNDLCVMPDGTLLSLERSAATGPPGFFNRIFEINFAGATDVSVGAAANALAGNPYTLVGKEQLWSDTINGPGGQNFEGLGLGPLLPNGKWAMLGVIDSSDGGSDNTVVAFSAEANTTADFNGDGAVDGADYLAWQAAFGKPVGAKLFEGDGDRDGDVDAADLQIWQTALAAPPIHAVPEPGSPLLATIAVLALRRARHPQIQTANASSG